MEEQGLKYFVFASLISAENDGLTEEVKQAIISRFGEEKDSMKAWEEYNWEYILEPIGDSDTIIRIAKHMKNDEE